MLLGSCLENPMEEEPGRLHVVHGVEKSRTRLATFHHDVSARSPRQAIASLNGYEKENWAGHMGIHVQILRTIFHKNQQVKLTGCAEWAFVYI